MNNNLTNPQKSIWYTQQYYKNTPVNNIGAYIYIHSNINFDILKQTVNEVVKSNDNMRLKFKLENDSLVQYINEFEPFDIDIVELSSKQDVINKTKSFANIPFEIENNLLFKFLLFKLPNNEGGVIINIHHIISDSWTLGLIGKEIADIYCKMLNNSYVFNKYPSYLEYIESENEYLNSSRFNKDKEFWEDKFKTVPEIASIPSYNNSTTTNISCNGNRKTFNINTKELNRIKEFCNNYNVSLYNFFMSVYSLYIGRVCSLDDFVIGTPILNRLNFAQKHTMGMFVSTIPLRINLNHNLSFIDFVKDITSNTMSSLRHQKYSYQLILEHLRKLNFSVPNLYNILLSYQITKSVEEDSSINCVTQWVENGCCADELQIHLSDINNESSITVAYDYNTNKYGEQDILDLHSRILSIINQVINDNNILLKNIQIVTEEEKHFLLNEFNNTTSDYPYTKTIVDLFKEQVKKVPNNIAVTFGDEKLTYKQLNEKSNQLANCLASKNLKGCKNIGIFTNRSISTIVGVLAILKLGKTFVPIDPLYPIDRINYMINSSKLNFILSDAEFNKVLDNTNLQVILIKDFSAYSKEFNSKNCNNPENNVYIIFTSGSTGTPKGVTISHRNLINLIWFEKEKTPILEANSKILQFATMSFDVSYQEIFSALLSGNTLVLISDTDRKNINSLINYISNNKISTLFIPPAYLRLLVEDAVNVKILSKSVKYIITAGEALLITPGVKELLNNNVQIFNHYGPAETHVATAYKVPKNIETTNVSIGAPISNSQIYILDENNNLCPINVTGQIAIGGDCVGNGYIDKTLNNNKFIDNPFKENSKLYLTGDLGFIDKNNLIQFIGRKDFQVKINGFRIELDEITKCLLNYPDINSCISVVNEINGKKYIFCYYTSDLNLDKKDIMCFLSSKLPKYMIPAKLVKLDALPINNNGKVDRKALPKVNLNIEEDFVPATTDTQIKLLNIWKEILNLSNISITSDFFNIGGDSLLAIKLCSFIEKEFNVNININDIFASSTIEDLSEVINNKNQTKKREIPHISLDVNYYPLSSAQKRIYYASSLDENSTLYNIAGGVVLDKELDVNKLNNCFKVLISKNDALRTHFDIKDEEVVQVVDNNFDFELSLDTCDTNNLDEVYSNFVKPFNLSKAPLFRAELVKLKNNKMLLLLDMHHIISDGTSLNVLIHELCTLYNGGQLPDKKIDYKDFTLWEQEQFNTKEFNDLKEFWVNQFKDEIPLLNMPTTYNRPSVQSFEGSNYYTNLSSEVVENINKLAKNLNITPYMLMLSCYYILLSKYTSQDDIVVGTAISGRELSELSNIIGMFVNSLALRNKIDNSLTFADFAKNIKENCLNCFKNQNYPFDALVKDLKISRNTGRSPLFDTMFIFQNEGYPVVSFEGINSEYFIPNNKISKFDLSLEIVPINNEYLIRFEYCTKLFDEDFIKRFSSHYINILYSILENNEIKLSEINMLSDQEKNQILFDFNNTKVAYDKEKTIVDLFEEQVEKTPDNIAVIFGEQKLTYKQLNEKANQLARFLIESGVKEKNIVGVMTHRSIEMIISVLAILKSGSAYLPIDPEYPIDRINYMLSDSKTDIILVDNTTENLNIDVFCKKINVNSNFDTFSTENINYSVAKGLIYVIYTSGSTGNPKGVMITHQNILNFIFGEKQFIDFSQNKVMVSLTTICFDIFALELWGSLTSGISLVLANEVEQLSPNKLKELCVKNNVTMIQTTPSRYLAILEQINYKDEFWNNFTDIMVGGEPFPKQLLKKLQLLTNANIFNMYGPTETTVWSTIKNLTSENKITIGKPIANTICYVLDSNGRFAPIGVPGTLFIGGDGVSKGYLNRNELTNEKFIKSPFNNDELIYNTGDLAYFNKYGELVLLGRTDSQVKIRGYRIELEEIENKILKYPSITDCVVIPIDSSTKLCAYYISANKIDISDLRSDLSKNLPNYMVPNYFVKMEKFPYTPNGKIDKKALPIPNSSTIIDNIQYVAPRNEIETILVNSLENILKIHNISVLDNFFNLGGDSISVITLCSQINQKLNIDLSFKDVMTHPIIEDLASVIENLQYKDNICIINKCTKREFYPASSAQKRMYLASSMDHSTLYNVPGGILLQHMPDVNKLQSAFDVILKRHDSLRTYFELIDGNIVQKIDDNLEIKIEQQKVNTNNIDEIFLAHMSIFNLNKAPLFKVFLFELPNNKALLMLDVHHIIFDGASLNILMKEISTLYNGGKLPELPISYKDYAVWEEQQLLNNGFNVSKDFWLKEFSNDIPILNMPTTFSRPVNKSYEGNTFTTFLDSEITQKINNLSSKYNVTPYMLMLCAYYILLYKYTGQEDIIVGSPASARLHSELEPLLGMFVNSIPLRSSISSSMSIQEFLLTIREVCTNAFAHQDYPFDLLVNDLKITKDSSRSPLFDTMFIYQNHGFVGVDFDSMEATLCTNTSHTSKFDLSLEVVPVKEELKLSFEYCTKLFDNNFITCLAEHYKNILNFMLKSPDSKISDICMLSEKEKNKIIYEFNNTQMDYPKDKTIIHLFEEQVQKTPNNIALVFEDTSLTYEQLNKKANQLARFLLNQGIKTGDTVGIMLHRSLEVIVSILAVLKTGACYIPIDPTLPSSRIEYMLSNSKVKILLVKSSIPIELKVNSTLNVSLAHTSIYTGCDDNLNILVDSNSPCYMIYTSGSTGLPKGIVLKHKSLTNLAVYLNNSVEFLKNEYSNIAIASITTISFDIFIFETLICLQRGLRIVIANEAEQNTPNLLDKLIEKNNIKAIQMTPSRMYIFINNQDLIPHLNNLKYIVLAGEALPNDLKNHILKLGDIKIYNGYGPSETTVFSTFTDVTNYEDINIGKPLGNTNIYILDKDKNICPIGIPGEIYISGDGVGLGYSNNIELTNELFTPDIFYPNQIMYKTGDLAKYLPNGEIYYIGRVDNQIKIRGLRIELDEIENCILDYPNIKNCVITAEEDNNHRQFIVAYLLVNDRISINKLRSFLKSMLPKYMVPSYFIVLDKFPYLNNGKINKKALPKPEMSQSSLESPSYIAPTTKLELQITEIFQNLLSISPIGIDDNFFELGGDSLLAINLQIELLKLNINITYSDIFIHPTVRELAKNVSDNKSSIFNVINSNDFKQFDDILANNIKLPDKIDSKKLGNVIITGTTGFLGAHILENFINNEDGIAYCLIRSEPGLTPIDKLIKKLHFYFDEKYDKYIGNRIIVVNADISESNLGLTDLKMEELANNVSCIINSAAKVTHFGNYNIYKEINVNGTENLLKFCLKFNKRFYQISTLSVSGNSLVDQSYMEQSFEDDVFFRENNFYINQSIDNVYVRSKFEAEKLVLQYILKGLDAYILRVGNLMNRYSDGKFQPNVDENAYISRLNSLLNIGCIPDYLLNGYMEFTPIDSCAEAIIKIAKHPNDNNRIFHLFNHNHIDVIVFINILRMYTSFDIVSNDDFLSKINELFKQSDSSNLLSGILRDFNNEQKLVYESKIKIRSEFTIKYLSKIGFEWPKIDINYIQKFLEYFNSIGYINWKEKK